MREHGLEWLFRLCSEPRRLWRRYLIYSTEFVLSLLFEMVGARKFDSAEGAMGKRALIIGITGQDGSYLAELNSSFEGSRGLNDRIKYVAVGLYISLLMCARTRCGARSP